MLRAVVTTTIPMLTFVMNLKQSLASEKLDTWGIACYNTGNIPDLESKRKWVLLFLDIESAMAAARTISKKFIWVAVISDYNKKGKVEATNIEDSMDSFYAILKNISSYPKLRFVKYVQSENLRRIIQNNEAGGIFHIYNSSLYSISSKELRDVVKNSLCSYLNGVVDKNKTKEALLRSYPKRGKTKEAFDTFLNLLETPEVLKLRESLIQIHKHKIKDSKEEEALIKRVAKKTGALAYDIRYMLAIYRKE